MKFETENEFIRGSAAGSLSAAFICLFLETFERYGLAKHCWLYLAGQSVTHFQHNALAGTLGLLIHLGVGAFWGVLIAFLFQKFLRINTTFSKDLSSD